MNNAIITAVYVIMALYNIRCDLLSIPFIIYNNEIENSYRKNINKENNVIL